MIDGLFTDRHENIFYHHIVVVAWLIAFEVSNMTVPTEIKLDWSRVNVIVFKVQFIVKGNLLKNSFLNIHSIDLIVNKTIRTIYKYSRRVLTILLDGSLPNSKTISSNTIKLLTEVLRSVVMIMNI